MGFFEFQKDIIDNYQIDITQSAIICINAPRNIGKTTSIFNWLFIDKRVDSTNKVLIIRNTAEQIKTAKQDFNARLLGRYQIWGNLIYVSIPVIHKDGSITYSRGEHVGYVGSLTTFTNMKSVEAKDVKYVFFDEYAQDTSLNVYANFIAMIKTFERFNKILIILLGNRESANNEWMLKWNVLPNTTDFENNRMVQFSKRGWFIEMGSANYLDLNNSECLSNELATFDNDTNIYLNMDGYKKDFTLDVINYNSIKDNITNLFYGIIFNNLKFGLIEVNKDYAMLVNNNQLIDFMESKNFAFLAIDEISYVDKNSDKITIQSRLKIVKMLLKLYKNNLLKFDSFDGLKTIQLITKYYRFSERS